MKTKGKGETQLCPMRRKIFLFMPCNTLPPVDFHRTVMTYKKWSEHFEKSWTEKTLSRMAYLEKNG